MKNQKNRTPYLFVFVLIVLAACKQQVTIDTPKPLPIVGEYDIDYKTVNGKEVADTIYHKVPTFNYLNQDSIWVHSSSIKSKIWIADFFFTSCPSICPPMTTNMKYLNEQLEDLTNHIQFLSFSIDPTNDQPQRLRHYIEERELRTENWHFLTGDEEATHLLAKEFFNGAQKDEDAAGGYGHTPYFALVDTKGHVRGVYDGTNLSAVNQLKEDIRFLLKSEYNVGK